MSLFHDAEDQQELDDLLYKLTTVIETVSANTMHLAHLQSVYNAGNLDCLRSFQYVLAEPDPSLFLIIEKCQHSVAEILHRQAATFLTPEMVAGALRINNTLRHRDIVADEESLYAVLFTHMKDIWDIFSLIEDHGITDAQAIVIALTAKKLSTQPADENATMNLSDHSHVNIVD